MVLVWVGMKCSIRLSRLDLAGVVVVVIEVGHRERCIGNSEVGVTWHWVELVVVTIG